MRRDAAPSFLGCILGLVATSQPGGRARHPQVRHDRRRPSTLGVDRLESREQAGTVLVGVASLGAVAPRPRAHHDARLNLTVGRNPGAAVGSQVAKPHAPQSATASGRATTTNPTHAATTGVAGSPSAARDGLGQHPTTSTAQRPTHRASVAASAQARGGGGAALSSGLHGGTASPAVSPGSGPLAGPASDNSSTPPLIPFGAQATTSTTAAPTSPALPNSVAVAAAGAGTVTSDATGAPARAAIASPTAAVVAPAAVVPAVATTPVIITRADASTLQGWTVLNDGGSAPQVGTITATPGGIVLVEGNSFDVGVERDLTIPAHPSTLTFNYDALSFETTASSHIRDAFEVGLVDANDQPLVPTIAASRNVFLNTTAGLAPATGSATTTATSNGVTTVTTDISNVAPGPARLVIRLINNSQDTQSTVRIPGVDLTPTVSVDLANDTAPAGSTVAAYRHDRLTTDPTVTGTAADLVGITTLTAQVGAGPTQDITSTLSNGAFRWTPTGLQPGPQHVLITATGGDGQTEVASTDFNLDGAPQAVAAAVTIPEGGTATLDGSASVPSIAALDSQGWTFADGTTAPGAITTRHYAKFGTDTATLNLVDIAGATAARTVTVTVANVAPVVAPLSPAVRPFGTPYPLAATFTDAGILDTHVATVDWGDGTPRQVVALTEAGGAGSVLAAHDYAAPGTFTPEVEVSDDGGLVGSATGSVVVTPAPQTPGDLNPPPYVVPGTLGTTTTVVFTLKAHQAAYHNAGGVYTVEDQGGRVAGLLPGQAGYARAAMTEAGRYLLFPQRSKLGATVTMTLPAGTLLAPFLVENASMRTALSRNPANRAGLSPHVFFEFAAANPDGFRHDRLTTASNGVTTIGTEDELRGFDRDYNDQIMTVAVRGAGPTTPSVVVSTGASTAGPTKFFVADGATGSLFRYDAAGQAGTVTSAALAARPTSVASDPTGARTWTVAAAGLVAIARADGTPLGSWQASGISDASGIAVVGTDVWIIDGSTHRVDRFVDAVGRTAGSQAAQGGFALTAADGAATGLVGDGTDFWVSDASGQGGRVFVYDRHGQALGSWATGAADPDPVGITLDPSGGTDLWTVDGSTGTIDRFAGGLSRRSGSHSFASASPLAAGNSDPVGIADPPPAPTVNPVAAAPAGRVAAGQSVLVTGQVPGLSTTSGTVAVNGQPADAVDAAGDYFRRVAVGPGPTTVQVTASDATGPSAATSTTITGDATPAGQVDLATLSDVTPSYTVAYGRTSFNKSTNILYADMTATNVGTFAVGTPLLVAVEHISNPQVRVQAPAGTLSDGTPYYNLSTLVAGGVSQPGQTTGTQTLSFDDVDRQPFTYDLVFLGHLAGPPAWATAPVVSTPAGHLYQYAAAASDPDAAQFGLTLHYTLISGPSGMAIAADSGRVTWSPTLADVGNHDVTLAVDDGQGRTDRQHFVLSVLDVPNRPPVFTSTPVVDAAVGTAYAYASAAVDPDADPVQFSVVVGPAGLTIDPTSGLVSWTPTAAQLGPQNVTLKVIDLDASGQPRGGQGLQTFAILVQPPHDHHPPVIVSTPPTTFNLPGTTDPTTGKVTPQGIALALGAGSTSQQTISVTLPQATGTISKADVFLLFDDTGSFASVAPTVISQFPGVISDLETAFPSVSFGFGVGRFEDYSGTNFDDDEDPQGRPFILNQPIITPTTTGFTTAINAALNRTTPGFGGDTPEADIEALYQAASGRGFDGDGDGTDTESGAAGLVSTQLDPGSSGDVPSFASFEADPSGPVLPGAGTLGGVGFRDGALPIVLLATDTGLAFQPDPTGATTITGAGGVSVPTTTFTQNVPYRDATPGGRGATIQQAITALNNLGALTIGLGAEDGGGTAEIREAVSAGAPRQTLTALATLTGAINRTGAAIASGDPTAPINPGDPFYFPIQPGNGASLNAGIEAAIRGAVLSAGIGVNVVATDPTGGFTNLTGVVGSVDPGGTATFTAQFTGDGTAHGYNLEFVQAGTGNVLGSIPVTISAGYSYDARALSPDQLPLAWSLPTAPAGATINATTGVLTWNPTTAGTYPFDVRVEDPLGGSDDQVYDVTVRSGVANQPPVITSTPPTAATVGAPIQYQVGAHDPDGDTLSYDLDSPPAGMTIDRTTGLISWTPTAAEAGAATATVRVLDGHGGSTLQAIALAVAAIAVNHPPQLTSFAPTTLVAGGTYRYAATATDPDADPLVFSLPVHPAGMAIDPATGQVIWTPNLDQTGTSSVLLRVSDGRGGVDVQSFEITVQAPEIPPVFDSTPVMAAVAGQVFQYQAHVQQADPTLAVTYTLAPGGPAGVTVDPATGVVTWTPTADEVGPQTLTLTATDSRGGAATQAFTLDVAPALAPEQPPVITSTPPATTGEGLTYLYPVLAASPVGAPLTYKLDAAPTGMTISAAGVIVWHPTIAQVGTSTIQVEVDDDRGGSATQTFRLTILAQPPTDQPPVITSTPPGIVTAGQPLVYTPSGTGDQGNPLSWSLVTAPPGMSVDPMTGTIRWTPLPTQIGAQPVDLRATDSAGQATDQKFTLDVRGAVLPPQFTSTPLTQGGAGTLYTYAAQAVDPQGQALTYTFDAAPIGMTIDPASGMIRWTPPTSGTATITLRATDLTGGTATQSFALVVAAAPPDVPPVITSTPPAAVLIGQTYRYQVTSTDPGGVALTFKLLSKPAGMSIDAATGLVTWTPAANQAGSASVDLAVVDPTGHGSEQTFAILARADHPPRITSTAPATPTTAGLTYLYNVQATDPDGDHLTYALTTAPSGMTIDGLGRITWATTRAAAGTHPVTVTATDPFGQADMQTFPVTVVPDTTAPTVVVLTDQTQYNIGDTVQFFVGATDDVAVASLTLSVGGRPVVVDGHGGASFPVTAAGTITAVATATDTAGNVSTTTVSFRVANPNGHAPVVALSAPLDGGKITGLTDIIGSVAAPDGNLTVYTLAVAPVATGQFTTIAQVATTSAVTNGKLGAFDPTMLADGSYEIRLTADNADGLEATTEVMVDVMGGLKLGNFHLTFSDLNLPLAGVPVTVSRTYDTLNAGTSGDFGYGWNLNEGVKVSVGLVPGAFGGSGMFPAFLQGTRVTITRPGSAPEGFTFDPVPETLFGVVIAYHPSFDPDPGVGSVLNVPDADLTLLDDGTYVNLDADLTPYNPADSIFGSTYTLEGDDGLTYDIDANAESLRSITDRNGNSLSYTDGGIFSSFGQAITFDRDFRGRISAITDPDGNTIRYQYDGFGNLIEVDDPNDPTEVDNPGGFATRYIYRTDHPHYLQEYRDPSLAADQPGVVAAYGSDGRVASIAGSGAAGPAYGYDVAGRAETIIQPDGRTAHVRYDALGNVLALTDPLGTTSYTYDSAGNPTSETDAVGQTTTLTYRDGQLTASAAPHAAGAAPATYTTYYTFDDQGNATSVLNPDGSQDLKSYDSAGNLLSESDGQGHLLARTVYGPHGLPTAMTDDSGTTTTVAYDAAGNPDQTTAPSGQTFDLSYTNSGRFRGATGPGVQYATTYDPRGREKTDDYGNGVTMTYTYGPGTDWVALDGPTIGHLAPTTTTSGQFSGYDGALAVSYGPDGQVARTVDAAGDVTTFTDSIANGTETNTQADSASGFTTSITTDAIGRVLSQTDAANRTTSVQYQADGSVVVTDPRGKKTVATSTPNSITTTDPLGHSTTDRTSDDGLTDTVTYATGTTTKTTYQYIDADSDIADTPTSLTDPEGHVRQITYDDDGTITSATDLAGAKTTYTAGSTANSTVATGPTGLKTTTTTDDAGNVTQVVYPDGGTEATRYDDDGNPLADDRPSGTTIQYGYDAAGNLASRTTSTGESTAYSTSDDGLDAMTDATGTTKYTHDPATGNLQRIDLPGGAAIAYQYNPDGQVTRVTAQAGTGQPAYVTSYHYDPAGNLDQVTDPAGHQTTFTYDDANRLVHRVLPDGVTSDYTYDALDQVATIVHRQANGQVIASVAYQRGLDGEPLRITREDGSFTTYTYDPGLRLASEVDHDATGTIEASTTYTYDAAGNRAGETTSAGASQYHYDGGGNLLSITGPAGTQQYTTDARRSDDADQPGRVGAHGRLQHQRPGHAGPEPERDRGQLYLQRSGRPRCRGGRDRHPPVSGSPPARRRTRLPLPRDERLGGSAGWVRVRGRPPALPLRGGRLDHRLPRRRDGFDHRSSGQHGDGPVPLRRLRQPRRLDRDRALDARRRLSLPGAVARRRNRSVQLPRPRVRPPDRPVPEPRPDRPRPASAGNLQQRSAGQLESPDQLGPDGDGNRIRCHRQYQRQPVVPGPQVGSHQRGPQRDQAALDRFCDTEHRQHLYRLHHRLAQLHRGPGWHHPREGLL